MAEVYTKDGRIIRIDGANNSYVDSTTDVLFLYDGKHEAIAVFNVGEIIGVVFTPAPENTVPA